MLTDETALDESELKYIIGLFQGTLADGATTSSIQVLRNLPETVPYPHFQRALQICNEDRTGMLSFAEFARALAHLSPRNTLEQKLKFAFKLFDSNETGSIEAEEVFLMLRMALGSNTSDEGLNRMVTKFMSSYPDGLGYEEFCQVISITDLNKLTLHLKGNK